jgi:hypothetical protein
LRAPAKLPEYLVKSPDLLRLLEMVAEALRELTIGRPIISFGSDFRPDWQLAKPTSVPGRSKNYLFRLADNLGTSLFYT